MSEFLSESGKYRLERVQHSAGKRLFDRDDGSEEAMVDGCPGRPWPDADSRETSREKVDETRVVIDRRWLSGQSASDQKSGN